MARRNLICFYVVHFLFPSTLNELDHLLESLRKKTEVNPKDVALMKRKERKEKKSSLKQVNAQSRKGRGKAKRLRRKRKGKNLLVFNNLINFKYPM